VGRLIFRTIRAGRSRALTLGAAILVATVGFVLLTSAVSTGTLRVQGSVTRNWRTAYDILVRPEGSFTALEKERGLVRENYLSGIFGGITVAQWRQVLAIPGVEIAAPIANIGYIVPFSRERIVINSHLNDDPNQLYRVRWSWLSDRGTSRFPGGTQYVYFNRTHRFKAIPPPFGTLYEIAELLPHGKPVRVCPFSFLQSRPRVPRTPFGWNSPANSLLECFASRSPQVSARNLVPFPAGEVGAGLDAYFPMLLAAIDPVQEQRLLDLGDSMVDGRYLQDSDRATVGGDNVTIPVIASQQTFVDETLEVTLERLDLPRGIGVPQLLASGQAYPTLSRLPGRVVGHEERGAQSMYEDLLARFSRSHPYGPDGYWTASPVTYSVVSGSDLVAETVSDQPSVWKHPAHKPFFPAPPGNQDVQFRQLRIHPFPCSSGEGCVGSTALDLVGRYDTRRLPGFSGLSQVPLESYYPPRARPADAASQEALGGQPLLPTMNLGGYVAQPPFMFTTIDAARTFLGYFEDSDVQAPISVIRVRVAGALDPNDLSFERIRVVAEEIRKRTGLAVDITAGSSPTPLDVELPAGRFGRPALKLREGWVKKGVSVAILDAVDRKSAALFALVLVGCILFLANGALASGRSRRSELGTLRCLGWARGEIFRLVLAETALIGITAGAAGAVLAAALVEALSLKMPVARTLLVPPVALAISMAAALLPAWRASRVAPLDAVRPSVAERGFTRDVHTLFTLVWANLRRVPGRTLLGALGLMVGVAALTLLIAVNLAFRGILTGTLLGNALSVQVRSVDVLSVVLVIALGGLAVADVLFVNVRERAGEFGSLRATGWSNRELSTLIALEGAGMAALGAMPGAVLGVVIAWVIAGFQAGVVMAGALAAAAGVIVAVAFALAPALLINRLAPASVMAEEP
jgi:putative ABC transport system permease protein